MGKVAGDRRREWWPVAREGAAAVWGTVAWKGRRRCGEPPRGRAAVVLARQRRGRSIDGESRRRGRGDGESAAAAM
jgi:hypothetical protein